LRESGGELIADRNVIVDDEQSYGARKHVLRRHHPDLR
jgi:hypothetical protein